MSLASFDLRILNTTLVPAAGAPVAMVVMNAVLSRFALYLNCTRTADGMSNM